MTQPLVGIIMGSDSDLPVMQQAAEALSELGVPFEMTIVSAHRTPRRLYDYAEAAVYRADARWCTRGDGGDQWGEKRGHTGSADRGYVRRRRARARDALQA